MTFLTTEERVGIVTFFVRMGAPALMVGAAGASANGVCGENDSRQYNSRFDETLLRRPELEECRHLRPSRLRLRQASRTGRGERTAQRRPVVDHGRGPIRMEALMGVVGAAALLATASAAWAEVYKDPTESVAIGTSTDDNAMGSIVGVSAGWGYGGLLGVGATNGATGYVAVGNGGLYTWGSLLAAGTSVFTCSDGIAVGTGHACGDYAGISSGACASGAYVAFSANSCAAGMLAAGGGGAAQGFLAASGTGPAYGWLAIGGGGADATNVAVAGTGNARSDPGEFKGIDSGGWAAASGGGAAESLMIAVSGMGPATGWWFAASGTGPAQSGQYGAVSGTGDATAWGVVSMSGTGAASGGDISVAGGNASGTTIAIGGGDATAYGGLAAIGGGSAASNGLVCASATGSCYGGARVGLAPLGNSS